MKINKNIDTDFSFANAQHRNATIYQFQNDIHYSTHDMVLKIGRYTGFIVKAVRKNTLGSVARPLTLGFSWVLALANRLHMDMEEETWRRFPGICPYCGGEKCSCKIRRKDRLAVMNAKGEPNRPKTLGEYQDMFRVIYGDCNTLESSTMHLVEEIFEVGEALEHHAACHDPKVLDGVREELVDVSTNMFGVANGAGLAITCHYQVMFSDGCVSCHCTPCHCGFTLVAGSITVK